MKEYKLNIKVTKDILKKSMMCGTKAMLISQNCAIALAVREIFPNAGIATDFFHTETDSEGLTTKKSYFIKLPQKVTEFIRSFDSLRYKPEKRLDLPELEFEVILPEGYINSINIDEVKEILKNSKTLELI